MKTSEEYKTYQGYGRSFSVRICRKSIKNMYLRVRSDGTAYVTANRYFSAERIDSFILSHLDYIYAEQKNAEKKQKLLSAPERYENGDMYLLLGKPVPVTVLKGRPEKADFSADRIVITIYDPENTEKKDRLFKSGLKKYTIQYLTAVCQKIQPLFAPFGITFPKLSFRTMTSRWGSCRPYKNAITLNLRLIQAPPESIEYVVLHEFAHFLHTDHSEKFYRVIAHFMPDWKARKQALRHL